MAGIRCIQRAVSDLHHRPNSLLHAHCLLRLRHLRLADQRCAEPYFEASMRHVVAVLQPRWQGPMPNLGLRRKHLLLARDHNHGRLLRLQRLHGLRFPNKPTQPEHSRDGRLHLHQSYQLCFVSLLPGFPSHHQGPEIRMRSQILRRYHRPYHRIFLQLWRTRRHEDFQLRRSKHCSRVSLRTTEEMPQWTE